MGSFSLGLCGVCWNCCRLSRCGWVANEDSGISGRLCFEKIITITRGAGIARGGSALHRS